MNDSSIALAPDLSDYFGEAVRETLRARRVDATLHAREYLTSLLCSYARPGEASPAFDRPVTLLFQEALESTAPDRFARLRKLGDGVLYAVGFFRKHLEQRGADPAYVESVGSAAYSHAAAMLRVPVARPARGEPEHDGRGAAAPDVLRELAEGFRAFGAVLRDIAEGTLLAGPRDERTIVKLYERWLETGSSRVASELSGLGVLPSRGGRA